MIIHFESNVPYLPSPNSVEFVVSNKLAPCELTMTSFMVPLLVDGSVVLANNRRRGLEIPGGHVDLGETLCAAAHRETVEETGYWVSNIRALGYLRMESFGTVPAGWKYPHPTSYQQFFVGRVMYHEPYVENDECLAPRVLSSSAAQILLNEQRRQIYLAALLTIR